MIYDADTAQCLAHAPVTAQCWTMRLRGMIGRRFTETMDAMIFPRCNAVHMLFMSIPLDVLFLDRENRVVRIVQGLRPWHPGIFAPGAVTAVEFPAGSLVGVIPGHRIGFGNAPEIMRNGSEKIRNNGR